MDCVQVRGPCRTCKDDLKPVFGCPLIGLAGKGAYPSKRRDIDDDSIVRTCPEWFATRAVFSDIYESIEDYRRGALGNVRALPLPFLALLRVLDNEMVIEKNEIEEAFYAG